MKSVIAIVVAIVLAASSQAVHAAPYTPPPSEPEPVSEPAAPEPQPAAPEPQPAAPAPQPAASEPEPVAPEPEPVAPEPEPVASEPEAPVVELRSVEVELTRISKLVYSEDYRKARAQLLILDGEFRNNADVNNMLGFTSRKIGLNASAATYYSKALRLDPNHLDALSYQGELFITLERVSQARENLTKLKTLCGVQCSQYSALKNALDAPTIESAAPVVQLPVVQFRSVQFELARISKLFSNKNFRNAQAQLRALDREFQGDANITNLLRSTWTPF